MRSFFYTSCAGFIFNWGVSLTHPMLVSFLSEEFLLHIPRWLYFSVGSFSYTSHSGFFFLFLLFFFLDYFLILFLLLFFNKGSFSYTSCAGFIFMRGASLNHPVLVSFFPGSFSYTSHAAFIFMCGVSVTHPVLS